MIEIGPNLTLVIQDIIMAIISITIVWIIFK